MNGAEGIPLDGAVAGAAAGLHRSVNVLLEAMRDLLTTTTNPRQPDDSDSSTDEEANPNPDQ